MEKEDMKRRREKMGLTQAQLSEMLGVKENTVYRWESGRLPISKTVELALERIEIMLQENSES